MRKFIKEFRAAQESKAQKDEGNAFTAALNAARKNGDSHFVVAGKKYKCEDYDENGDMKKKDMKKKDDDEDEDEEDEQEEDASNDKSDDGEGMDKVDPKAVKKKFDDRKDKDINNDGKTDASDKYLHRRRKAISKSETEDEPKKNNGEEEVVMNPKKDDKKQQKESKIRSALMSVFEDKHTKGAAKPDEESTERNASAKKMKDGHPEDKSMKDMEDKSHDDASKAGRVTKQSPMRGNDSKIGDRNIINKIAAAYKGMSK